MTITKEMIEAAQNAYRAKDKDVEGMESGRAYDLCWKAAFEAAERASREPVGPDAKTGDDVHLGCFGEYSYGLQFIAFWDDESEDQLRHWQAPGGRAYRDELTTHWRPLPSPPEKKDGN